jgi:hypothetical protein
MSEDVEIEGTFLRHENNLQDRRSKKDAGTKGGRPDKLVLEVKGKEVPITVWAKYGTIDVEKGILEILKKMVPGDIILLSANKKVDGKWTNYTLNKKTPITIKVIKVDTTEQKML